jgi:hypothetical protein
MRNKKQEKLDAVKFRNAIIGINEDIQGAIIAAQLGMRGGNSVILKGLRKIDTLCKHSIGQPRD